MNRRVKILIIIWCVCFLLPNKNILAINSNSHVDLMVGNYCGNGSLEGGETCDDGNNNNGDGCSSVCTTEYCGDNIVNSGEICDSNTGSCTIGGYSGNRLCNATCDGWNVCVPTQSCGDSVINGGEVCDDGNNNNCDGCRSDCTRADRVCGDGYLECGEDCDGSVGVTSGFACSNNCVLSNISKGGSLFPQIFNLEIANLYKRIAAKEAVLNWSTNKASECSLFWGDTPDLLLGQLQEVSREKTHRAHLSSLIPKTEYYFDINCNDGWGHSAESELMNFITEDEVDKTPPGSVDNFQVEIAGSEVRLSWDKPKDSDLQGVRIVRSEKKFPRGIADGLIIYDNLGGSVTDTNVEFGKIYYYAAFTYDDKGNYSAPAIATAEIPEKIIPKNDKNNNKTNPSKQDSEIKIVIPGKKDTNKGGKIGGGVIISDLDIYLGEGGGVIKLKNNGSIRTLPKASLNINLPLDKGAIKPNEELIVSIIPKDKNNKVVKNYLLRAKNNLSNVNIFSPVQPGEYDVFLTTVDSDGKIIGRNKSDLIVENFGVVRGQNLFGKEKPLPGVKIYLFEIKDGIAKLWSAEKYYQSNPSYTNSAGYYGFVVENGMYQIRIDVDGYNTYSSEVFETKNNLINKDIKLVKEPLWKSINYRLIFVWILFLMILFFIILIAKKRKKIKK